MAKKLLSSDYTVFVQGAFKIPETDFYNYYFNIVNEHVEDNIDVVEKLINAVNEQIDLYRNRRGTHQAWEVDEKGNRIAINWDEGSMSLLPVFGINRKINKSFFDNQIVQLEDINSLVDLRSCVKKYENTLPENVFHEANKIYPYNGELDFEKIQKRKEALDKVWETYLLKNEDASNKVDSSPPKRKFIANEKALAYIFDLYATGKQIPENHTEGGLSAKEIKKIGAEKGFDKPDTFYRAVRNVSKYDLSRKRDLNNISHGWLTAVETLSDHWDKTREYLIQQGLIESSSNNIVE